ncbi:cinnamoyl-CoA reductase 1 [Ricinus communis]|uniref:cinnamoyl-CoA reductase 1 n=1 Tax=Ricinus communis TaxID=3988 RepID=UPI000D68F1FE|nr:cinnamoyl-CoA reductase 1 [Ricinus communis]|eukprot:XP_025012472.1 cinnamoyl-CoA reductase 1 [Ricinus communis]
MADQNRTVVCVTGAGGFVASWLIKLLLAKGYIVRGTVRDPENEKNAHLWKLDRATENLKLFKAELLDYNALYSAIEGCSGVFHVASPLPSSAVQNPEMELIEPAVKGTLNVLKACLEANVNRTIVVSSGAAVSMNPSWPKDQVKDESCWSDKQFQKKLDNWYGLSKTEAEAAALDFAETSALDVVRVCPVLVLGPILQSTANSSTLFLIRQLKGGRESSDNRLQKIVDVRDVAEALLLAYEKPEAEGRYICAAHMIMAKDLVDKLKSLYPDYKYPKSFVEGHEEPKMSSEKLQKLGWSYRPLEETLIDSIESYRAVGLLN